MYLFVIEPRGLQRVLKGVPLNLCAHSCRHPTITSGTERRPTVCCSIGWWPSTRAIAVP